VPERGEAAVAIDGAGRVGAGRAGAGTLDGAIDGAIDGGVLADLLAERAIRDLLADFADCITRKATGEVRRLFTADGTWDVTGWGTHTGHDAVFAFIDGILGQWESIVHCTHSGRIVLGPDRTTATGRWIISEFGTKDGAEVRFAGVYHDRYVLVDGAWRFALRRFDGMFSRIAGSVATVQPFPAELDGDLAAVFGPA
jgi:hypothetical protein